MAVGATERERERERAIEREHARERATERDAKWRALARVVVALAGGGRRGPEGGWQWVQRREREWKELQRR